MTEAIYSTDAYCRCFTARVLSCEAEKNGWTVLLDRTAFFPEQGGQYADTGTLDDALVSDVQIRDGMIFHVTDRPLSPGTSVTGKIDWDKRYARMQNHTGEHIVSGLIHTKYGYDNVGFHLNDTEVTLDTSGELSRAQLEEIEAAANRAVYENLPVGISFPVPDALASLDYRAKLELTENVRIITIPGYDACACCAPHVHTTGEVGMIKILDAIRYKGGMRIRMMCGAYALADYRMRWNVTTAAANALHGRAEEIPEGIERLSGQIAALKNTLYNLRRAHLQLRMEVQPYVEGNLCFIEEGADAASLRELVNAGMEKCSGVCAAFTDDGKGGYTFVIGAKKIPLRSHAKEITAALSGRGGGTDQMISGSASADADTIRAYFAQLQL